MDSTKDELMRMIGDVANALSSFSGDFCFVGGAVACLYCDRNSNAPVRPTKDVDCVIEVTGRVDFYDKEEELRSLGFKNDMSSRVICRWRLGEIIVDIMPTNPDILNFSNKWYALGFNQRVEVDLFNGTRINIFSLPYYLATKFEALLDRGGEDWRLSHDLEDILYILSSNKDADNKILASEESVRNFLLGLFRQLSSRRDFEDILSAHIGIGPVDQISRVRNLVNSLAKGS